MRWERLFADLEGQADDEALLERDALIDELRQGELAATSWRQLCGGEVTLMVAGIGRVSGEVLTGAEHVLHIRSERQHILINPPSVMGILRRTRRATAVPNVASRLGWPYVFRSFGRDQDRITVHRVDSSTAAGVVVQVGRDWVELRDDAGNTPMIPFASIVAVSCPR